MPGVPGAPGLEPRRHWLSLPSAFPSGGAGGAFPPAALVRPAPGERTFSNAEVPLPRSPLSLAAGTAHTEPLPVGFALTRGFLSPAGHLLGKFCKCRGRLNAGDARGEAPCIRKQKNLPLPRRGRGLGVYPSPSGKGGKKANQRQGRRAAKRASHPQGTVNARRDGNAGGKPPTGYHSGRDCKCRGRLNAGDARGEAPCIRKQKNLPLPTGKGGRGDGGRKSNQRQGRRAAKRASLPTAL